MLKKQLYRKICFSFILAIFVFGCQPHRKEATKTSNTKRASTAEIEEGIKTYIKEKTANEGGYFHIKNEKHNLRLKLVRVHTEYIANLGPESHFACVDLADVSGDVYDVDFFLEGEPGAMEITQTTVHKLNGKPYYTWKQNKDKTWSTVPVENASNALLGVIEGEDEFEFYYEVQLPEINGAANLWLPIAQNDSFQTIDIVSIQGAEDQRMLKEEDYGNKILFLTLGPDQSNNSIKITYNVKRKEKGPYVGETVDLEKYLQEVPLLPVGGRFTSIVDEALAGKKQDNKLVQARAIYDYIIDNMSYKKAGTYGTGDANYACDSKSGNCTEFHSFFISLARSAGIPARFAIGAAIPSERNEGGINGYHCWAEFYAEGKWWPVDISEGNKYTALATYYFGHHPANRIELSKGRNLHLDPQPAEGAIKFMAYPVLEVEGESVPVKTTFSFKRSIKNS